MAKRKATNIVSIVIGFIVYFTGFSGLVGSRKVQALLMLLGGVLAFVPLLLLGIKLKRDKKVLGIGLIVVSTFFAFVITLVTLSFIIMF